MLLMLLIAQIMMILRNESMKIKEAISAGYIILKAAGCLGNYAATILALGLTPSDSDCLQHNFLTTGALTTIYLQLLRH